MTVVKRSVSLDPEVAAGVERAAKEDGTSFSGWLSNLAERELRIREGLRAVAEYEAEYGALPPEALAEADRILDELNVHGPTRNGR